MLQRLRMIFRSLFGWLLRGAENPELILRQHMDDLRNEIPRLNEQAAQIVKLEKMLEQQAERQRAQVADMQAKVEQAVKMGESAKEAALSLIEALESARAELADTEQQLEQARVNSKRVLEARTVYERRIRDKMNECLRQMSRAKRAEMEKQMASLMASFQVGDSTEVLDRMTQRIDEELAEARARTQVASESVEGKMLQVEIQASRSQAETKYREYQRQFGLIPDEEPPVKTMESIPVAEEKAQQQEQQQQGQTQQGQGQQ